VVELPVELLLVPPVDPPSVSPTFFLHVKILSRDRQENRIGRFPAAHGCRAKRTLDLRPEPFRERDREPVPGRNEGLYPNQPGLSLEHEPRGFAQFRGRNAPQPFRKQNMGGGHHGRSPFEDDHACDIAAVFA
jgi:hypothetical protein